MTRGRRHILAALLLLTFTAAGCAKIRHVAQPFILEGHPSPIEVSVRLGKGQTASGNVHYRQNGDTDYQRLQLQALAGGKTLSASLPATLSESGHAIEYYIDVLRGDEPLALYSPGVPRRVPVLNHDQYVLRTLRLRVDHTHAGHPVRFVLHTGGLEVHEAVLTYQAPGIPGWTTASMRRLNRTSLDVLIPGEHVDAGWWNYRLDVVVDGTEYGIPTENWNSFEVGQRPVPPRVTGGSKQPTG